MSVCSLGQPQLWHLQLPKAQQSRQDSFSSLKECPPSAWQPRGSSPCPGCLAPPLTPKWLCCSLVPAQVNKPRGGPLLGPRYLSTLSVMMSISSSLGLTKKMMFLTSAGGSRPGLSVNIFSTSCSCVGARPSAERGSAGARPPARGAYLEQRVLRDEPEGAGQVLVPHDGLREGTAGSHGPRRTRTPPGPAAPPRPPWSPRTCRGTRAARAAPPRAAQSGSPGPSSGAPPWPPARSRDRVPDRSRDCGGGAAQPHGARGGGEQPGAERGCASGHVCVTCV